jgi:hypothetical protein
VVPRVYGDGATTSALVVTGGAGWRVRVVPPLALLAPGSIDRSYVPLTVGTGAELVGPAHAAAPRSVNAANCMIHVEIRATFFMESSSPGHVSRHAS